VASSSDRAPSPVISAFRTSGLTLAAVVLLTGWAVLHLTSFRLFIYNGILLAMVGAVALNLLMGVAGQASIGNAAFLAVGGFSTVVFERAGLNPVLGIVAAALVAAAVGLVVGLPALRIVGIYLVLATLAAHFIVLFFAERYQTDEKAVAGFQVAPFFHGHGQLAEQRSWAWLLTGLVGIVVIIVALVSHGRAGRAWRMVRDHEIAAPALGIEVRHFKLSAFVLSSAIIGMQGAFAAHLTSSVSSDSYTLAIAIAYIAMIVIGGLDSIPGALLGAVIITWLPTLIPVVVERVTGSAGSSSIHAPRIAQIVYGLFIVVFVTLSSGGIVGWFKTARRRIHARRRPAVALGDRDSLPATNP
jgi:branched-chain amino acid transport system permease protein